MYQPYTYLIAWTHLNTFYYGVRYSKSIEGKTPEQDLWISYFTSSHHVQKFREDHGEPDRIEIRRVFNSAEKARQWEEKFLKRIKVVEKENWLNKTYGDSKYCPPNHTEESRFKISRALKGRIFSKEHRNKLSESSKGNKSATDTKWYTNGEINIRLKHQQSIPEGFRLGRAKLTKEWIKNLSESKKGKKKSKDHRKKIGKSLKGRIPWNKGKKLKEQKFRWITNGNKTIMIKVSDPIPVGFRPGRK